MRVAIDVRPVVDSAAGIGQYTLNLVRSLAQLERGPELILLGEDKTRSDLLPAGDRCTWVRLRSGPLWHLRAKRAFERSGAHLYHSPSSALVPLALKSKAVVTVHDLVPVLFPETSSRRSRLGYRFLERAVSQAGAVISVSERTRQDILRLWTPGREIEVVHEAPRVLPPPLAVKELERLTGVRPPYFLAVGTVEPRKNLGVLIDAWDLARRRTSGFPKLVLVGPAGWGGAPDRLLRAVKEASGDLISLGFRSDEELTSLYKHSVGYVAPSIYEGFGLPALEAASLGTPILAAEAGATPEILADAALYFDSHDAAGLASLMERLATDRRLRREVGSRCKARSREFSWKKAARETLVVYESLG